MLGGSADTTAELIDSPASLVTFILLLLHNFDMESTIAIDEWLRLLEREIKDVVVSKHSTHLAEAERILKGETSLVSFCCLYIHDESCYMMKPHPLSFI